jgi:predicted lipoprotein with Yx(FWY)xxD motif
MTRRPLLLVLATVAASAPATSAGAMPAHDAQRARPTVQVDDSRFGRVLFDRRGFALYLFTRDREDRSTCSGACAKAWPPYLLPKGRRPTAGRGARRALLGTIRRKDGTRQVTYAGHPLYFYVGDTKAGEIRCQNVVEFGGTWLVQRPDGRPVT